MKLNESGQEERFDLILNPPKVLKVRTILAALHGVDIDRFPETHGQVKRKMRQTLRENLDWEYELAIKVMAQRRRRL
jgi:DNA-binding transcriptional regulator YdaS (Cro superfamily)